jgi:hypothetical protein
MSALHNWHAVQLDFALAFPQAPVEKDLCVDVPKGSDMIEGNRTDHALKIHRSICGQKQAGRVWNQCLTDKLVGELKSVQSRHNECVFCRGTTMHALQADNSTLAGPDEAETDQRIKEMQEAKLDIAVEGDLQDFLGAKIERKADGTVHSTQPHLINQILKDLRLEDKNATTKPMPCCHQNHCQDTCWIQRLSMDLSIADQQLENATAWRRARAATLCASLTSARRSPVTPNKSTERLHGGWVAAQRQRKTKEPC